MGDSGDFDEAGDQSRGLDLVSLEGCHCTLFIRGEHGLCVVRSQPGGVLLLVASDTGLASNVRRFTARVQADPWCDQKQDRNVNRHDFRILPGEGSGQDFRERAGVQFLLNCR